MVDSVRFPPAIGGSGRTYTNDANPDTGLFNGGHRKNLVPMLDDAAQAAGFVSRYAQAIDGAKKNADRAEDARGYVEAYAGTLNQGLHRYYADLATLHIDFRKGRYFIDDGERTESSDLHEFLTVQRGSPKRGYGPTGNMREVPSNRLLREWINGVPKGVRLEGSKTNLFTYSDDLARWNVESGIEIKKQNGINYFDRIGSGSTYVRSGTMAIIPEEAYTFQGVFTPLNARSLLVYFTNQFITQGTNLRIRFDADTLKAGIVFNAEGGQLLDAGIEALGGGRFYVWATLRSSTDVTGDMRPLIYASDPNGLASTVAQGRLLGIEWLQFEQGYRSSYIPTGATVVTRPGERIMFSTAGILNEYEGTWLVDFEMNRPINSGAVNILTPANATSNQRLIYRFGGTNLRVYDGDRSASAVTESNQTGERCRVAVTLRRGEFRVAVNGALSTIAPHNNSFLDPAVMSMMELAFGGIADGYYRFFEVMYLPQWLGASQLQELTAFEGGV